MRSPQGEPLYIVFDGEPGHVSGRFVEVENADGEGRAIGEWTQHGEFWRLGPVYAYADDVLEEVRKERAHQDEMWGGPEHDDRHPVSYWFDEISARFFDPARVSAAVTRRHLVEIAGLAVAGIESLDRKA